MGQPRVLLVNHGRAGDFKGGDSVQINETGKRLSQRGWDVSHVQADQPNPQGCDLVHIFNSRCVDSLKQQLACCKAAKVPVVLSPIWITIPRAIWGSRCTMQTLREVVQAGRPDHHPLLDQLRMRQMVLQDENTGTQLSAEGSHSGDQYGVKELRYLLRSVDALLPNSYLELQSVRSDLHWHSNNFRVAHYGVDPRIFLDADPRPFREQTGIQGPFVLQAGRIEPAKNQAMLCWALRHTNLQIVLIGSTENWPGYAELCKGISGDRLKIIDHMPQALLASAYAACSTHVLGSWMETCGLVSLEAALAGAPIVASTFGHELEYLEGDAWYADPADAESILAAVVSAIESGRQDQRVYNLKQRILERFNWERTAHETELLYRQVLNGNV